VFGEAFHTLAANVRLLDADDPVRAVVIASATAGEGKTTIAAYLAQAVARMNRRVLVVDTDLRRPQIHQRLGLVNGDGLTDVLSGDLSPEEAIQASALDENLFVLTAGMLPPDPIRLISSQKMQELMRSLREQFDLVIYDAPPLAGLADAHLLAAHSDGLLLVAGLGELKRSALEQSLYELSVANTPVLGAIANFAKEAASYPSKGSDRKVTPTPSSSTPTSKELASLAGTAAPSKKLIPPPKH
jgi:capsular exopolysaccharide synthesis family protein